MYRIHGWGDTVLNVPPAYVDTRNYSASLGHKVFFVDTPSFFFTLVAFLHLVPFLTLGHKVNHAKEPNSEFRFLWHPRFGDNMQQGISSD